MLFTWDPTKAATNATKHGVTFEEAASIFRDHLAATGDDPAHSIDEQRLITFGTSTQGRLLVVAHTDDGETIRIISARAATKPERRLYEQHH